MPLTMGVAKLVPSAVVWSLPKVEPLSDSISREVLVTLEPGAEVSRFARGC
jgi:hypothetical protein